MKKLLLLFVLFSLFTVPAFAGSSALPFESGLDTIAKSLSGPVAISIGMIAFVLAGAAYVFNPDMSSIVKGLLAVVMGLAIAFGGKGLIDILFKPSSSGNVIVITEPEILSDKICNIDEQDL